MGHPDAGGGGEMKGRKRSLRDNERSGVSEFVTDIVSKSQGFSDRDSEVHCG